MKNWYKIPESYDQIDIQSEREGIMDRRKYHSANFNKVVPIKTPAPWLETPREFFVQCKPCVPVRHPL